MDPKMTWRRRLFIPVACARRRLSHSRLVPGRIPHPEESCNRLEMVTQDSANAPFFDPITRKFRPGGVRNLPVSVFQLNSSVHSNGNKRCTRNFHPQKMNPEAEQIDMHHSNLLKKPVATILILTGKFTNCDGAMGYAFNMIVADVRQPATHYGGSACPMKAHQLTGAGNNSFRWSIALVGNPVTVFTQTQDPASRLVELEQTISA